MLFLCFTRTIFISLEEHRVMCTFYDFRPLEKNHEDSRELANKQ
jgi:hypothetical protein